MYSYAPTPAVLTQLRAHTPTAPRYAASGGKTFGRPMERLRNSVVRGARKWQRRMGTSGIKRHESESVFYERIVEDDQSSSAECIPLLPIDVDHTELTTTPCPPARIERTDTAERTLRRTKSGFFRAPQSKRWRRTRKFAKFILHILASIFIYPPVIYHPDYL